MIGWVLKHQREHSKHQKLISDEELPQLKILIDENRPNTLQDIRALWPQPVSLSTISRAVIRLNYSVKKRQFLTLKEMKGNGSYI